MIRPNHGNHSFVALHPNGKRIKVFFSHSSQINCFQFKVETENAEEKKTMKQHTGVIANVFEKQFNIYTIFSFFFFTSHKFSSFWRSFGEIVNKMLALRAHKLHYKFPYCAHKLFQANKHSAMHRDLKYINAGKALRHCHTEKSRWIASMFWVQGVEVSAKTMYVIFIEISPYRSNRLRGTIFSSCR